MVTLLQFMEKGMSQWKKSCHNFENPRFSWCFMSRTITSLHHQCSTCLVSSASIWSVERCPTPHPENILFWVGPFAESSQKSHFLKFSVVINIRNRTRLECGRFFPLIVMSLHRKVPQTLRITMNQFCFKQKGRIQFKKWSGKLQNKVIQLISQIHMFRKLPRIFLQKLQFATRKKFSPAHFQRDLHSHHCSFHFWHSESLCEHQKAGNSSEPRKRDHNTISIEQPHNMKDFDSNRTVHQDWSNVLRNVAQNFPGSAWNLLNNAIITCQCHDILCDELRRLLIHDLPGHDEHHEILQSKIIFDRIRLLMIHSPLNWVRKIVRCHPSNREKCTMYPQQFWESMMFRYYLA
jgi:hypothetical protein